MSQKSNLIKGYLPVRVYLPPCWNEEHYDETFFYVREHQAKSAKGTDTKANKATLFVANAPFVPDVSTKVLLRSIFGRYGEVSRVTVIQNPRGENAQKSADSLLEWTSKFQEPSLLPINFCEGKFAHVVFANPKAMKKAYKALQDVMKEDKSKDYPPGLTLERIEIQTLADESSRLYREQRRQELGQEPSSAFDEDSDDDQEIAMESLSGVHAIVARYQATLDELSQDRLMDECNAVIQEYEEKEEAKRLAKEAAKSQPDDDGFVTVSYSNAVGSQVEFEETKTGATISRRKGNKRSRKKKEGVGSKELEDFYRFQRRENKKRTLEDLRAQFEEDLKRVKRLKEERQYKPF